MSSITDKLEYSLETKELIKQSIIDKGVEISDEDTLRSYANKISEITTGGAQDLLISCNQILETSTALAGDNKLTFNFTNCKIGEVIVLIFRNGGTVSDSEFINIKPSSSYTRVDYKKITKDGDLSVTVNYDTSSIYRYGIGYKLVNVDHIKYTGNFYYSEIDTSLTSTHLADLNRLSKNNKLIWFLYSDYAWDSGNAATYSITPKDVDLKYSTSQSSKGAVRLFTVLDIDNNVSLTHSIDCSSNLTVKRYLDAIELIPRKNLFKAEEASF